MAWWKKVAEIAGSVAKVAAPIVAILSPKAGKIVGAVGQGADAAKKD